MGHMGLISKLGFLSLTQHCPLLLMVGVRVHSLSPLTMDAVKDAQFLTTDEVKGKVNI
jgi:hypothetical protein